jgi:hypothetical protein
MAVWPLQVDQVNKGPVRAALAVSLLAMLAACGTTGTGSGTRTPAPQTSPPPTFNLAGYSAQYKRGHADGCAQRRDDRLFRDDADYMMGWNDGSSACARKRR